MFAPRDLHIECNERLSVYLVILIIEVNDLHAQGGIVHVRVVQLGFLGVPPCTLWVIVVGGHRDYTRCSGSASRRGGGHSVRVTASENDIGGQQDARTHPSQSPV